LRALEVLATPRSDAPYLKRSTPLPPAPSIPVTLVFGTKCAPKDTVLLNSVIAKVFGTSNERAVKRIQPTVAKINALEPAVQALSDEALRNKTAEFRQRIAAAISHIADTPENADERYAAEKEALNAIL